MEGRVDGEVAGRHTGEEGIRGDPKRLSRESCRRVEGLFGQGRRREEERKERKVSSAETREDESALLR